MKKPGNYIYLLKWVLKNSKEYRWRIILMLFINLFFSIASLVTVILSKSIIDNATMGKDFSTIIIIYIIVMLATLLFHAGSSLISAVINEKVSFGIRKSVYDKVIRTSWQSINKYHSGDIVTRLSSDAGNIADAIVTTLPSIITLIVELILVFFTLFSYSPFLAFLGLTVAPVAVIVSWLFARKLKVLQKKVQESESAYHSFLQESLANLLIIKAFANEDESVEKLAQLRANRFYWVFKRSKAGLYGTTTISLAFHIGYLSAFTFGAIQISKAAITYGTMSVFLALINRVQSPIIGLSQQLPKVIAMFTSAERIIELSDMPAEKKLDTNIDTTRLGVYANGLTFGYDEKETVLENVSFKINPGESTAVIGESGIGKTTLIRLVLSFVEPSAGSITFFNDKSEELPASAGIREYISYVPQGNTLFSGTIKDNILIGRTDAADEDIKEALKLASAWDFVEDLPEGINTRIGEKGLGLSEGQAQRIAIARAIIRKAPFMIFDEATSALDEGTEQKVIHGLEQLSPRPSCLIITHRKSILKYCTQELMISDKKIFSRDISNQ
jgi:ABC-type multidrug transport system fused ATPase/permease subunit